MALLALHCHLVLKLRRPCVTGLFHSDPWLAVSVHGSSVRFIKRGHLVVVSDFSDLGRTPSVQLQPMRHLVAPMGTMCPLKRLGRSTCERVVHPHGAILLIVREYSGFNFRRIRHCGS